MSKSLPKQIGELFAHFQDLTDTVKLNIIKRIHENKNNKLLSFFSSIGDSYFKKYFEIKKDSKPTKKT